VPGQTVTKEVVKTVQVPGETVVVEKEVPVEVERQVVVEKEVVVVKEVEVEKQVVVEKEVERVVDPRYGGSLRVVNFCCFSNLDPLFGAQTNTIHLSTHIYEPLLGWDSTYNSQPQMVKEWDVSGDGLTYTFTLRDGLSFHNGKQTTSDDVIASLDRWLAAPEGSTGRVFIDDLVNVGALAFEVKLKEPFGGLPGVLGMSPGGSPYIWPKEAIEDTPYTEALGLEGWIGTGPYKVADWVKGDRLIAERFEDYQSRDEGYDFLAGGKKAYLDEIVWLEIPDDETKVAGLATGQWDVVINLGFDFFSRLEKDTEIRTLVTKPGSQAQLLFNSNVPPADNVKFRQAIQAVVDHDAMMASLGDNRLWMLCPAILFCGSPLETDVSSEFYNQKAPEKAKALLEEAGYDGEPVTILTAIDTAQIYPLGLVLKPTLESIGINVDMPAQDFATMVTRLGNKDWHILTGFCESWYCGEPLLSTRIGGSSTFGIPGYPDLQRGFALAESPEERLSLAEEAQIRMRQDVWYIPLGQWFELHASRKWVKNLSDEFIPIYWNAWIEK
jgi:peptide/nickel transport system substrate-binding protein